MADKTLPQLPDRQDRTGNQLVVLLAKWCYYLAVSGGDIIRKVVDSGALNTFNKAGDSGAHFNPTTDADRWTQAWIIGNLRRQFPSIAIIGEEDQKNDVPNPINELPDIGENDAYFAISEWDPDVVSAKPEDVRVFVDPVDGTNDLTKGRYEVVTVLVGIAIARKPVYGVVHYPFSQRTIHAAVGHSKHRNPVQSTQKRLEQNIVVTTSSHLTDFLQSYLKNLQPQPAKINHVGGCGHKAMLIIDGKADAYLYPQRGCKKWDTCAPHAIIRALGGHMVDKYGDELEYDEAAGLKNANGLICTLTADPSLYVVKRTGHLV